MEKSKEGTKGFCSFSHDHNHNHNHNTTTTNKDIKPENILLKSQDDLAIKLADFGFAKMFEQTMRINTACGTPGYLIQFLFFNLLDDFMSNYLDLMRFHIQLNNNPFLSDTWPQKCYMRMTMELLLIYGVLV